MSLKDADIFELQDRFMFVVKEYSKLALEMAPLWEKFGKYKTELELLVVEFNRRGFDPKEPDGIRKLLEEEIKKRNA